MKYFIIGLSALFFLLPHQSIKAQELSDAQKQEIEALLKSYILENGEVILDGVNNYQEKLAQEQQEAAQKQAVEYVEKLSAQENLPMAGNKDGDITIVEFFDYNCGYCTRALEEIQTVLKRDDNVKVIFIEMPILGASSMEAAKWALASVNQGKYWDYHQAIMEFTGDKSERNLERLAKDVGLDVEQLKKDKDSQEINDTLNENIQAAQSMGIRGTPGFIIGKQVAPGYIPAARIQDIIKEQRAAQS
ncbi:MAG: DsbA family protein [Pseudomonadota bacterium]